MASRRHIDDDHFRKFAGSLREAIAKYQAVPEGELMKLQKDQVERLVALEKEFRQTLIKHPWGPSVYRGFVKHICEEKRNILAARPYFRERQTVFTNQISKALKKRQATSLYRFHFNYEFVLFVLEQKRWEDNNIGGKIVSLAKQIRDLRWELVEMNMPLAINRARIFWSRTPKAQLSYMDLVQITSMGLMSGIDKFCLPYSQAFRHTVIGRMIGNLIEQYSETLVHFYPVDKRKIYRANKLVNKFGENPDWEKLAEEVNRDVEPAHRTNAIEIADLMAASSTVSSDSPMQGGNGSEGDEEGAALPLETFQADESTHPDVRVETHEALMVMSRAIPELPLLEQKLLRMKGVSL
jgi:DNA-directed RNA polymerase specialized sigma subunit